MIGTKNNNNTRESIKKFLNFVMQKDEDGNYISEWSVSINDLKDFLETL